MNKYYSSVIKKQLNLLDLPRELSFKQVKVYFLKNLKKIFNKKNLKKKLY